MVPLFTGFFRKKGLKKHSSRLQTGMIPLSGIHSATVLMDSQDSGAEKCIAEMRAFFRKAGVQPEILFIDTRSPRKRKEGPVTPEESTFLRKDMNWYGRLKNEVLSSRLGRQCDLYMDLTARDDYPVIFIARAVKARFKAGCTSSGDSPFDIAVTPPGQGEASSTEMFRSMAKLLESIRI